VKKVREGYKMTELGEIPNEWNVVKLKEVLELLKDGTHNPPKRTEIGIPLLSVENIFNGKVNYGLNEKCISLDDYSLMHKSYEIEKGNILMTIVGTIGRVAIVKEDRKFSVQRSVAILKNNKKINNEFLAKFLSSDICKKELDRKSNSTAQAGLYLGELAKINIISPTLKEQEKIASILSTVDEQIDSVDELIQKNKELKKGLMQQLLTKGIGHTKFKKTEIGEIPEEWEVRRIIDIADTTSGGTPSRAKKEYYINGIYPWVKTGELYSKYIRETEEYITEEALKKSSAKLVPVNTVIIAMYGATIGKLSITKRKVTTNQACCSIICNDNICYNEYLYYRLDFEKEIIINLGAGGAQPNISQDIIKNYKIAIPGIEEQKKIALILSEVDKKIEEYEKKKKRLEELKKGLMQQLLTGKIRV
jgi:type I restriction enzyme, S subunit